MSHVPASGPTATASSNIPITTTAGYFAPPSNAMQAYLYPSLALALGIAVTIIVCRIIDRRRRVRRAQTIEQLREARLAKTLGDKPKMYEVAIETSDSPYALDKPQTYLWADLLPISGSLTCREQSSGSVVRPRSIQLSPGERERASSVITAIFLSCQARYRRQRAGNTPGHPIALGIGLVGPASSMTVPPYDTIVTSVMIAMPSDRNSRTRKESNNDDGQFPELVLGCVESDWRS
ncbi:hypothetical protein FRB94_006374 [Tulasnella sp. JGI-2019a]|nr:hypothetical protein FRB93_001891 [Tulasnella sp. JGI-2019a]KAG8999240.1 hypothetical protein FRB94_006374 [Tulasnella sp. JGI-2019a]KAG9026727.1 hypothetical protein FRB95_008533 [Tulasnella sp. JGI-2019a]